jgi:hypothetical protein
VVGLAIAAAGCGGGDDSTTEDELDDIRALTPPEGDERQVDAILDAAEAAVAVVGERRSRFVTGSPFAEANTLAAEYGLRVCGR